MKKFKYFTKAKSEKGITLIALIVTIVVLIIIAGISIATLTADNGVLRQTNSAKVESIEGTAREQVKLAVGAMRLAIAEAQSLDNSYKASANTSAIKNKLLEVIRADTTALEKDGWSSADDTTNSFKIIYAGDDYKQACNDDNAEIVYTITLGQKSIEITNETNATLKDQSGNDVNLDIGGSTGEGTGNGSGSGSGEGSGEGGSGDSSTSYTVSLEVNIPEAGTVEFTSEGHSGTKLNLKGEQTVSMRATANGGYAFVGWYVGDTLLSTDAEYSLTVNTATKIEGRFEVNCVDFTVTASNRDKVGYTGEEGEKLVIPEKFEDTDGTWYKVVAIGDAFYNCTNLASVTIPDSVTKINGGSAFGACVNLKTVYYEGTLEQWCNITFSNSNSNPCYNGATLYIDGELVEDITIPNTVTEIKKYAFQGCTSLTSVAFEENSQLTSINENAFWKCKKLANITILASEPPALNYNPFNECSNIATITVPAGCGDAYKTASGWSSYASKIVEAQ